MNNKMDVKNKCTYFNTRVNYRSHSVYQTNLTRNECDDNRYTDFYMFRHFLSTIIKECLYQLKFYIKMINEFKSNTSYFILCGATCFGLYVTIIRPSCESSQ